MSGVVDILRAELRDFAGYSSARKEASGGKVWLNANESPWSAVGDDQGLNRYPDPQPVALVNRLAALYQVAPDQLLVGRGSDEAIDLLTRAACRAGRDSVLISAPTFGMYAVCARVQDAAVVNIPLRVADGFALDVKAIAATVSETSEADQRIKLIYICSPNNPTGAAVSLADIEHIAGTARDRTLVVVDEAYAEFNDAESAIRLLPHYPNLLVLRTLSKAFAMAGARIGCVIGDPGLIAVLRSIMAPYPLPTPCVLAALAALQDNATALVRSRIALLRSERARLVRALRDLPQVLKVFESDANFVLVRFQDAAATYRGALTAGIVLRLPAPQPGLENCVRISIGTPEENQRLLAFLADQAPVVSPLKAEASA
ncbi:MAG: histidinol-phosphate transaminase [Pseudomarimonas sp.]